MEPSDHESWQQRRSLDEAIAHVAHRCWRESLEAQGWTCGAYDPDDLTHDAMVGFDELNERDQLRLLGAIGAEQLSTQLAAIVRHRRDAFAGFITSDLRLGLPIQLNSDGPFHGMSGEVTGWSLNPDGTVESITASWQDGSTSTHAPFSDEISPLER